MSRTKQVIVIRKDLKMRRGKEVAQGSHASQEWLIRRMEQGEGMSAEEYAWLHSGHAKCVVRVNSESELIEVFAEALARGLTAHIVRDEGVTEFGGVHTLTALAVGPHEEDKFAGVTDHLEAY